MTDRFALSYADSPLMARIKDTSVDAVKAAADFVEVVSARTQLRKAGARYTGRCPFHEERTPSFSVNAVDKLYYCFGCGAKGDLITFVRETEGLDFADSIEWLGERFRSPDRVRGELARAGRGAAGGASGCSRSSTRRRRSTSGHCGTRRPAGWRATTSRDAGWARRCAASSGSASRSAAPARAQGAREGLHHARS